MVSQKFFPDGVGKKPQPISSVLREIARIGVVGSGWFWSAVEGERS